jgi:hypothetical protein
MQEAATAGWGGVEYMYSHRKMWSVCGGGAGWLPQLNIIGIYVPEAQFMVV